MGGIFFHGHSLLLERYDLLDQEERDDFWGRIQEIEIDDTSVDPLPKQHDDLHRRIGIVAVDRYPGFQKRQPCGYAVVSHHRPKAEGPDQACLERLVVANRVRGNRVGAALLLAMLDATCLGEDRVADPLRLVERLRQGHLEEPTDAIDPLVRSACQDGGAELPIASDVRYIIYDSYTDMQNMDMRYTWSNPA